jgi:hypothetical protein
MLQPFQYLRCALRAMRRSCIVRVGALTALALMPALAQTVPPHNTFPKESTPMSWKTECIGRVLIDMPTDRPRSWSAQIDVASVRRLQRPLNLNQFWSGAETVRDQYAKAAHREHTSRLGHYERMDARKAAIVIGYPSPNSLAGAWMWRLVHLDDQHAYEFKTEAIGTRGARPSPELFKPYVDEASPVLSRIKPLRDGEIPSSEGLCIDGALVSGETGRNAVAALNVEIAKGTRLGASYLENNYQVSLESVFEELKRDQDRADFALTLRNEPLGYKEFKVLRRQERTLAGLRGQEFITRTTLNNGHFYYTFRWGIKGGAGLVEPTLSIHMDTPSTAKAPDGSVYAALPPEAELIRLWDSALVTFRLRPGALPAGQVLRAVN